MLIEYEKLPTDFFLKVLRVNDLRRAKVLTLKEIKEKGLDDKDVILESPLGYIEYITRKELVENFKYPDGKPIRLLRWVRGKKYIVTTEDNTLMYALYVPKKVKIKLDGELVNGGENYIVCLSNESGEIEKTYKFVVPRDIFKKMFKYSDLTELHRFIKEGVKNKNIQQIDFGENISSVKPVMSEIKEQAVSKIEKQRNKQEKPQKILNIKEYRAIGKIINENEVIGFVLEHTESGEIIKTNKVETMELCLKKKIKNLGARELNGKLYLHGVGLKIKDLPALSAENMESKFSE